MFRAILAGVVQRLPKVPNLLLVRVRHLLNAALFRGGLSVHDSLNTGTISLIFLIKKKFISFFLNFYL